MKLKKINNYLEIILIELRKEITTFFLKKYIFQI